MTEIMQMVIDKLGVNVGETFKLRDMNNYISHTCYYFNEYGRIDSYEDVHKYNLQGFFIGLITGEYKIVKIPFKPTYKESYRYISCDGSDYTTSWSGTLVDYYRFNAKNCFRTEEEITKENKKRILTEMKREYENG